MSARILRLVAMRLSGFVSSINRLRMRHLVFCSPTTCRPGATSPTPSETRTAIVAGANKRRKVSVPSCGQRRRYWKSAAASARRCRACSPRWLTFPLTDVASTSVGHGWRWVEIGYTNIVSPQTCLWQTLGRFLLPMTRSMLSIVRTRLAQRRPRTAAPSRVFTRCPHRRRTHRAVV